MKLSAVVIGFAVLAAPAFAGPAEGGAIFESKCMMCHGSGVANAPLVEKLATLDNAKIIEALTTPIPMMAGVVGTLSEDDKRNIAVYLTKKTLPASGGHPEVKAE